MIRTVNEVPQQVVIDPVELFPKIGCSLQQKTSQALRTGVSRERYVEHRVSWGDEVVIEGGSIPRVEGGQAGGERLAQSEHQGDEHDSHKQIGRNNKHCARLANAAQVDDSDEHQDHETDQQGVRLERRDC